MLSETSRQNPEPRNLQGIVDGERRPLTQIQSAPCNHRRPQRNTLKIEAHAEKAQKKKIASVRVDVTNGSEFQLVKSPSKDHEER